MLLAFLIAATAIFAIPFDPDSLDEVRGQKRYSYIYDHGAYSELDSLNLATHYTQTGRAGEIFAFENSAGGDTIFTILTTEGETLNVGKVDTVYGEGSESPRAWRMIMTGVMQDSVPKVRTIVEEWTCDFGMQWDADTSYHDLGDESFHNVYYEGGSELDVRWTAWVTSGILTWSAIELSIEEIKNHSLPADNKILPYPNPFNSAVSISAPEGAEIEVFDVNGRRVGAWRRHARTGLPPSNPYETVWQPSPALGSGVYLVRATVGEQSTSKRIVYLK